MHLFEKFIDSNNSIHRKSAYQKISEVDNSMSECVRERLESWFVAYSEDNKVDLHKRFTSINDKEHFGAYLELLSYTIFVQLASKIRAQVKIGSGKPDMEMTISGITFTCECTVTLGAELEQKSKLYEKIVLDVIEKIPCRYKIGVSFDDYIESPPNAKEIRKIIRELTVKYSDEAIDTIIATSNFKELPMLKYKSGKTEIQFNISRRKDDSERVVGTISTGMREVHLRDAVYSALKAKSKKYKDLQHPILLILGYAGNRSPHMAIESVREALLGQFANVIVINSKEIKAKGPVLQPNGIWNSPEGLHNSRVAGVLFFPCLPYSNLNELKPTLIVNPQSDINDKLDIPFAKQYIREGVLEINDGDSVGSVLSKI